VAYVHFELPDALVEEARAAGISIDQVAHEALSAALAGRSLGAESKARAVEYTGNIVDDTDRYRQGRSIGELWTRTLATVAEIAEIMDLQSSRWRDIALDTTQHSLGALLVERGEVAATRAGMAWIQRDSFSEGLVDAVAATSVKAERP